MYQHITQPLALLAIGEWTDGLTVCSDPGQRKSVDPRWWSYSLCPHIYKTTSSCLVWHTVKWRCDHPFITMSSSPTFHLYYSIVDTSLPGNGTWTVWSHLFFHGTVNERGTACSFSTDQIRFFSFLFPIREEIFHSLWRRIKRPGTR